MCSSLCGLVCDFWKLSSRLKCSIKSQTCVRNSPPFLSSWAWWFAWQRVVQMLYPFPTRWRLVPLICPFGYLIVTYLHNVYQKISFFIIFMLKWGREWKSEKIKDILISFICVWLGGWKSGGIEYFFCLVEIKNESIEDRVCKNLSSYSC